jgi:hypothetical protein
MKRRTLIKQLAFVSGSLVLIPACMEDRSKASMLLKNISIGGDEEMMMADLGETIIPKTETPGAKDIGAHLFALMMVDDCYKAADQQKFVAGLKAFEVKTKNQFSKSFSKCSIEERETLLNELEAKKKDISDLQYFYINTKRLVIQAYTTSKFYLTEVQVYKLVPGKFYGCVPLNKAS